MPADAKQRLIDDIVSSLGNGVPQRMQELQIRHFYRADPAYGSGVARLALKHRRNYGKKTSQRRGLNANR